MNWQQLGAGERHQLHGDRSGRLDSAAAALLLEQWLVEGPEPQPVEAAPVQRGKKDGDEILLQTTGAMSSSGPASAARCHRSRQGRDGRDLLCFLEQLIPSTAPTTPC